MGKNMGVRSYNWPVVVAVAAAVGGSWLAQTSTASAVRYVPDRLIVSFKSGTDGSDQKGVIQGAGGTRTGRIASMHLGLAKPRPGQSVDALRRNLKRHVAVRHVERDSYVNLLKEPNDPLFSAYQYSLNELGTVNTGALQTWNTKTSCKKKRVAILDTGVEVDHPDLRNNIWYNDKEVPDNGIDDEHDGYVDDYYGVNLLRGRGDGEDNNGHGTHVAGIVGAISNNGIGVSGICWQAKLMAVKFMDAKGEGTVSKGIEAIRYAVDHGAKVVNGSFGTEADSQSLEDVLSYAKEKGVLVTVAAGNDGKDIDKHPLYPASSTKGNVISIAASTPNDALATYSNYGAKSVDLAAPGSEIASTYLNDKYVSQSGTSMAAPMVAGAAALIWSKHPDYSYKDIKSALKHVNKKSAFSSKTVTGGRLNLEKALKALDD